MPDDSRPAENKQTVEARAAGFRYWAMADGNPKSTWLITRETARAVVAQADRVAELEAVLRVIRPNLKTIAARTTDREPDKHFIRMLANEAIMEIDALAGDGGGA